MARDFNGSSDKLLGTGASVISAVPATMSAWARPDVTNAEKEIAGCSRSSDANPLFRIAMSSTGKPFCQFRNDAAQASRADGTTTLSTTVWQHVLGTIDSSGTAKIFYNGTNEATGATPAGVTVTLNQTEIGVLQRNSAAQFWDGVIAEVGYWSVVLSAGEIIALSKGVSPLRVNAQNLVGYYPVYGVASPETNLAAATPTLTVTGTTLANHAPTMPAFGFDYGWRGAFTAAGGAPSGWAHLLGESRNRLVYT